MENNGKPRATTLAEIARLAGVSTSTVSRALAGSSVISDKTRERINALASAHGFQLNAMARNLRLGRTGAIGILLPLGHERGKHLHDPFFLTLLGYLADEIAMRDYDLLLSRVIPDNAHWLDSYIMAGRIDGVIVIGQSDQSATLQRVAESYDPMVVWGAHLPGLNYMTVGTDNELGGRLAARHLLEKGCRRPIFFGNVDAPEFALRHAGFAAEVREKAPGIPLPPPVTMTAHDCHARTIAYLRDNPAPDAIFAASDVIAMGILRALGEAGLSVPAQTCVIGFDDVPLAAHTSPPLTTIRQDLESGARLLCTLLFDRLEGRKAGPAMLPPQLIERESTRRQ